jgi:hypothetical protein
MFAIGDSEPLHTTSHELVRHSIVWLGAACGETARGIPGTHPLGCALFRILQAVDFVGSWLTFHEVSLMREFELKRTLLRLNKSNWVIAPNLSKVVGAHRDVTPNEPWPYESCPELPWPQSEILVAGFRATSADLRSECMGRGPWLRAIAGEARVLGSSLELRLAGGDGCAVTIGRTHTENSPGLSIIAKMRTFNPETFVEPERVAGVHRFQDASLAWSYGRITS